MKDRSLSPTAFKFRIVRSIATLTTLSAIATAFTASLTALAETSGTNQNVPGLADTPGPKSAVTPVDRSLTEGSLKFQNGLALLNSAVLLKVYFYAYSGTPIEYSEILTENTENIVVPKSVQANDVQKRVIDKLVQIAKAHPSVLIKVDDIALEAYEKANQSYAIVNRLFINDTKYYFDNSPYHYFFADVGTFRNWQCTDTKTRTIIDSAITNYEHFLIDIEGDVSRVVVKDKSLVINLHKVTLMKSTGDVLITNVVPGKHAP